uniref:envelope membrane protein n=1 Tax=Carex laevissima TaxID=432994 RepID=UPI001EDE29E0|nr:envelope membrane protein [Carex laevissima]UHY39447.1 envelope membrane protein [Carex laevissima]
MKKKKTSSSFPYFVSIAFLAWSVFLSFQECLELWISNWRNTSQSETLLNYIQEKYVLERFIEFEELFFLEEMKKEYLETYIKKPSIEIHKETIKLVSTYNEYNLYILLHFSTNLICFSILTGYFILSNEELMILNSWAQELLYNLSDTTKAFSIILVTDLGIGFHSTHNWELLIGSVYNDFGLAYKDQIISGLVSIFPVILDAIVKYWIFNYLNRVSPSLVVIYHSMNE